MRRAQAAPTEVQNYSGLGTVLSSSNIQRARSQDPPKLLNFSILNFF
jgi:hypothetical protein